MLRAFAQNMTRKPPIVWRASRLRTPSYDTIVRITRDFEEAGHKLHKIDTVAVEVCAQWCKHNGWEYCIAYHPNHVYTIWRFS